MTDRYRLLAFDDRTMRSPTVPGGGGTGIDAPVPSQPEGDGAGDPGAVQGPPPRERGDG